MEQGTLFNAIGFGEIKLLVHKKTGPSSSIVPLYGW